MSRPVKSVALWVVLTLVLAAAVHVGIVLAIPYVVGIRLRSMVEANTVFHAPRISSHYNPIRRSSPDLVYSVCAYDLAEGPLHITAPSSGTYTSVSCLALNSDNFYTRNDQQVNGVFDFVLVGPGAADPEAPPGSDVVRSPTTTGGIVFRYFVGDGTHHKQIESARREIRVARFVE